MEAILSNSTRKLLWFEIAKMLMQLKNKSIVSFIKIFSTLSSPVETVHVCVHVRVIWPSNSAVK